MSETQKVAVLTGLSNKWSITYGVLLELVAQNTKVVVFTLPFLVEKAKKAIVDIDPTIEVLPMDVAGNDDDIIAGAAYVKEKYGTIHYLLHAIAGTDGKEMEKDITEMSRENFLRTMDISAYSFKALCQHFAPLMTEGGGIVCLTFAGSHQNAPAYGVMGAAKAALESTMRYLAAVYAPKGIFVNAVSAGPIKTISGMGISLFTLSLFMSMLRSLTGKLLDLRKLGRDIVRVLQTETMVGAVIHCDNGIFHLVGMGSTPQEMAVMLAEKERRAAEKPAD